MDDRAPSTPRWMLIGRIAGSFGVRGEIKVEARTDFPERYHGLATVYLGPEHRPHQVQSSRAHKHQILLRLAGVDSPEAVETLRGLDVSVPRTEAVALPAGHYYLDDLIGITVSTPSGEMVGQITDVLRTGNNDVYVVNEGRQEILIPATKDAVRRLDLERRQMLVEPWALRPPE